MALAFSKSVDFPFDKPAGEPCENLDGQDACTVHSELRPRGFKGCTVFDCFGAGQKISRHTFEGRSWRDDLGTRDAMFSTFPIVRRLHELLWYLDQAVTLVDGDADRAPLVSQFERVVALSNLPPDQLKDVDIDAEFDRARPLLIEASSIARGIGDAIGQTTRGGRILGPGSDLMGSKLAQIDLSGQTLPGSLLIGADLQSARLNQCDLLGVDMRDANLAGADLDGAIYLTQMQVNSARGDDSTVLPDGFSRPSHWKAL